MLVIIGLIVGGVLVGQDMIAGAAVRAQITQIEKYNAAVNTFRCKYKACPGDIQGTQAAAFGFVTRAGTQGRGDGDGILEGFDYVGSQAYTCSISNECYISGEPLFFWEDLSSAKMVDGSFSRAIDATDTGFCNGCGVNDISLLFPRAKLGNSNYIYAYSTGAQNNFGILGIISFQYFIYLAQPSLTVAQAYNIDKKMDDGLPLTGKVIVQAFTNTNWWGTNGGTVSGAFGGGSQWLGFGTAAGTATPSSATTCYDNGGSASAAMQYSMTQGGGAYVNCALSFQMQGASR